MASCGLPPNNGSDIDQDQEQGQEGQTYRYEPLQSSQHIRLLRLAPGNGDTPLRCSLVQHSPVSFWPYEALSYAWGDASDRRDVTCDESRVSVTRNLFEALCQFRHPLYPRYIWADAICIDQQNIPERNAQVQLMALIYSRASKVLLWLGPEEPDLIDAAFRFISRFMIERLRDLFQEHRWMNLQTSWVVISFCLASMDGTHGITVTPDEGTVTALIRLLSSPVFTRGWVIQEVALASSLDICRGQAQIDVDWLYNAIELLLEEKDDLIVDLEALSGLTGLRNMYSIRGAARGQGKTFNYHFLQLISLARSSNFSDERDRVYGLLALQHPEDDPEKWETYVKPDYAADKLEAYRKVAEKCMVEEKRIEVLLHVHHEKGIDEKWLSWVPDWKEWGWVDLKPDPKSSTQQMEIYTRVIEGHDCICIHGIRVDVISKVMDSHTSAPFDQDFQTLLNQLWESFDPVHVAYSATAGVAIQPGRKPTFDNPPNPYETAFQTNACRAFLDIDLANNSLPKSLAPEHSEPPSEVEMAILFSYHYRKHLSKKRFFGTSHGMLGLGPAITQKDDVLVVLFGEHPGDLAFILRPVDGLWRLVGPCFVYQVATGQVVEQWEESGEPAEDFCIY